MPDVDLTAELDRLSKIERAATKGEWRLRIAEGMGDWSAGSKPYSIPRVEADAKPGGVGVFDAPEDAEFTATSRTAMPRLLAALRAVLELAGNANPILSGFSDMSVIGFTLDPKAIREAITREITGKGESDV